VTPASVLATAQTYLDLAKPVIIVTMPVEPAPAAAGGGK
jgi:hypothetical protein